MHLARSRCGDSKSWHYQWCIKITASNYPNPSKSRGSASVVQLVNTNYSTKLVFILGGGVEGGEVACSTVQPPRRGWGETAARPNRQWERQRSALTAPRKRYLRWPLETRNSGEKQGGQGTPRSTSEHEPNTCRIKFLTPEIFGNSGGGGSWRRSTTPPHERRDENKSPSPALLLHFSRTRTSRHFTKKQRLAQYGERVAIWHRRRTLPHTLPLKDVYTRHKSERRAFSSTKQWIVLPGSYLICLHGPSYSQMTLCRTRRALSRRLVFFHELSNASRETFHLNLRFHFKPPL